MVPASEHPSHTTSKKFWLPIALLTVFYLLTHVLSLTLLPVFADEAIYIRWAQLIMDEPGRYLFFALNDGKTPLFIWLLLPFQYLFSNQLAAARVVSVLVGLGQMYLFGYLTHQLGGRVKTVWFSMLLISLLPFWYFHHRMALMDGLLTLWLSVALIFVIKLTKPDTFSEATLWARRWLILGLGLSFGLALLTKLPAVLSLPAFGLFVFWPSKISFKTRFQLALQLGLGLGLGLGFFGLLKLNPAFGQLFSRGSDFLYPWREVIFHGQWRQTLPNIPTYTSYFITYLTLPILLFSLTGLFLKTHQRTFHLLFWAALLFLGPICLLGRVVYPRYLLPAALFLTLSAPLALQTVLDHWAQVRHQLAGKAILSLVIAILIGNTLATSSVFITQALSNTTAIPFVPADRTQYLTEWSSGHGLTETVALINQTTQTTSLAVATEGYFGTLPDGLLLYFHNRPVDGLYLEGIGQPVASIPSVFSDRAKNFDRTWLVVNSHRLRMTLPPASKIAEFCRPDAAPCLQVWDITPLIKN